MSAWVGVIGALAAATIALLGQYIISRSAQREREVILLLDQCAQLVALSEDYRNRIWEERKLGYTNSVSNWSIGEYRVAEARLKILCREDATLDAITRLRVTGVELGRAWRLSDPSGRKSILRGGITGKRLMTSLKLALLLFAEGSQDLNPVLMAELLCE